MIVLQGLVDGRQIPIEGNDAASPQRLPCEKLGKSFAKPAVSRTRHQLRADPSMEILVREHRQQGDLGRHHCIAVQNDGKSVAEFGARDAAVSRTLPGLMKRDTATMQTSLSSRC